MRGLDGKDRELVLGRRTHEIFEASAVPAADHQPAEPSTGEVERRAKLADEAG